MAAASVAVTSAEHDVRVQLRFAILQRDVADERQNLHLLAHCDALVPMVVNVTRAGWAAVGTVQKQLGFIVMAD
jgi:hypothetical protein